MASVRREGAVEVVVVMAAAVRGMAYQVTAMAVAATATAEAATEEEVREGAVVVAREAELEAVGAAVAYP
jgi:hypothetical protein